MAVVNPSLIAATPQVMAATVFSGVTGGVIAAKFFNCDSKEKPY